MEQMIKKAMLARRRLDEAITGLFDGSMLISSIVTGLVGLLLAAYVPAENIAPLGVGCAAGVWFAGVSPYFACAGAFLGYLLGGSYAFAAAAAALAAAIVILERYLELRRVYRLLIAFGVEVTVLSVYYLISGGQLVFALGASSVSVLSAVILGHGIRAAGMLTARRELTDAELLTLAASAGMITLSFGNINILGQSPAMLFAGICSLLLAYRCGAASVAFAVTVGAGRVLATGGDMHFIAVISASVLIAASLRSLGKTAVMLGFGAANLIFSLFMRGTAIFSVFENIFCCSVFMLLPSSLYMPCGSATNAPARALQETRYNSIQYSISGLSEVLRGLARVYGGELGQMLLCISDTLQRTVSGADSRRAAAFAVSCGCAAAKKSESSRSGDSVIIKNVNGCTLMCLSDGMGSGEAAYLQSKETVGMLCDLITVGFDMQAASQCINRLMTMRAKDDMYATLDAVLIDGSDGTARLLKLGAPPSYVIRGGKLYTLYAENLPLGITEEAEAPLRRIALKRGDVIVLMTDGAADGLGPSLAAALTDCSYACESPEDAAEQIIKAASRDGTADDMTVIWARID